MSELTPRLVSQATPSDGKAAEDCTDTAGLSELGELAATVSKSDPDGFADAYGKYLEKWRALPPECQPPSLGPIELAQKTIVRSRAELDSATDRLRLATDETAINALSTSAKKSVASAIAAYSAVSASEHAPNSQQQWPSITCLSSRGYLTGYAAPAVAFDSEGKAIAPKSNLPGKVQEVGNYYCQALQAYGLFSGSASSRRGAAKSLCGGYGQDGEYRRFCLTYGLISSAVAYVWKTGRAPSGMSGSELISLLVPYGGIRYTPSPGTIGRFIAIDLNLYSAYLTVSPQKPQPTACIANGNALERSLHCETNPSIHPYAAIGLGMTIGEDKVGYLSLVPVSFGFAQFGSQGIHPYFGMYASILQLTGRF